MHPLTILSTLPSAGIGVLLALLACQTELSIIALIGIFLLLGIVMKNAIMMIDFALSLEREQGLGSLEAIHLAGVMRFRPILMTTLAAAFGALPLLLALGDGSELRRPLGITIVGGLLVSQWLTLYTTPVVYLYLDRWRLRRQASDPGCRRPMTAGVDTWLTSVRFPWFFEVCIYGLPLLEFSQGCSGHVLVHDTT